MKSWHKNTSLRPNTAGDELSHTSTPDTNETLMSPAPNFCTNSGFAQMLCLEASPVERRGHAACEPTNTVPMAPI